MTTQDFLTWGHSHNILEGRDEITIPWEKLVTRPQVDGQEVMTDREERLQALEQCQLAVEHALCLYQELYHDICKMVTGAIAREKGEVKISSNNVLQEFKA